MSTIPRRDFFKSLAGLFAAVAINPGDPFRGLAPQPKPIPVSEAKEIASKFRELTQFMHAELARQLRGIPFLPAYNLDTKIGDTQRIREDRGDKTLLTYTHQLGVDMVLDFETIEKLSDRQICKRFVEPAMRVLACEVERQNAKGFARLPHPPTFGDIDSCIVSDGKIYLRGLRGFDITSGRYIHRFDILFAS